MAAEEEEEFVGNGRREVMLALTIFRMHLNESIMPNLIFDEAVAGASKESKVKTESRKFKAPMRIAPAGV